MNKEHILFAKELEPQGLSLRRLTPQDYQQFTEVAQSAWPGIRMFSEPIFVALTDNGVSIAATEGQEMIGASFNFIKPGSRKGEFALYVHMLGTKQDRQGKGVGRKIMRENYRVVETGEVGPGITEVKLTSDPLEAKNVMFYLHHMGMSVHTYLPDAYKSLRTAGAQQHTGLPADRFVYTARPKESWSQERRLPTPEEYLAYITSHPNAVKMFNHDNDADTFEHFPVVLVEVPLHIDEVKQTNIEEALSWRKYQQNLFSSLFSEQERFSAVDAVKLFTQDTVRQFIVCMQNFDQQNPECLTQQLDQM